METVGHSFQRYSFIESDGLNSGGEMMKNYKYLGGFICHLSSYIYVTNAF